MKRTLLLVSLATVLSANDSFAQMTESPATKTSTSKNDIDKTSAIKPTDGQPYMFSSKETLESSVPEKIKGLRDQILSGKLTEAQITELREQIWRLENATVAK